MRMSKNYKKHDACWAETLVCAIGLTAIVIALAIQAAKSWDHVTEVTPTTTETGE